MQNPIDKLLADYHAAPACFNEMLVANNQPRAHWRTMLEGLAQEEPEIMHQRLAFVQQQVRENGVTYNVYGDAMGQQRPWDLNVLPMIIPQNEWSEIESAVVQRATLLNRVLGDVYGEQYLLQEGLLPPALIHGHAGFLRPCHGIKHPDEVALHFYAVDLARAPNGRWWAVADRTQAPSGAGYALENRTIIGRTFPDLLRDLRVKPLAGFFDTMRESLVHWGRGCAAQGKANSPLRDSESPLMVLLTPGRYNETYYEQAYLARYLGLPLVEGGDLTVRDGIVWLKSLSGLQRVHVIMRRVDDDFCDPLELRTDSALGVAGLTEAARRGNVLIANSLGSNLLESGALLGFLPALSQRLLGESLQMPSVATWWCGEPAALDEVIDKLDHLVIKPTFPQLRLPIVFGQDLKGSARKAFIHDLRSNPSNYVAQELVKLSQAPVWNSGKAGGLSARAIGLRVYACATPNGYVVMPGGLTRVATGSDARIITMQRGGGSKDTWVQSSAHADSLTTLKRTITSRDLIRDDTHLSCRVAENLFWFGRHTERCDNVVRLLRAALSVLFNVEPENRSDEWPTIVKLCIWFQILKPEALVLDNFNGQSQSQGTKHSQSRSQLGRQVVALTDDQIENVLLRSAVSPEVPGLAKQKQQLYKTASHLQDRFSIDNWCALNRMVQQEANSKHKLTQSEAMSLLDEAAASIMTLSGFALDGMTRDLGWRFLSIGRRLERLQFQSLVLQRALAMSLNSRLDWLLELSDSAVTYRARYRAQPEWLPVLDLLLLDESNPRSIVFQLDGIVQSLNKIKRSYGVFGDAQLVALKEETSLLMPDTDFYCGNARLIELLKRIQTASEMISESISLQFFSYTGNQSFKQQTA
jgi:uncharacterized circularly permuted ATP-grasp superfamily protein/uncharacterized alpha-E superfamily protein